MIPKANKGIFFFILLCLCMQGQAQSERSFGFMAHSGFVIGHHAEMAAMVEIAQSCGIKAKIGG